MKRINWLPGLTIFLAGVLLLTGFILKAATWNFWPFSVVRSIDEVINFYRGGNIGLALGLSISGLVLALLGTSRHISLLMGADNSPWNFTALGLGLLSFTFMIFSGILESAVFLAATGGQNFLAEPMARLYAAFVYNLQVLVNNLALILSAGFSLFLSGILLREKKLLIRIAGILAGLSGLLFVASLGVFLAGLGPLAGILKVIQQLTFYLMFIFWGLSAWRLAPAPGTIPEAKEKKPAPRPEKPVKAPKNKDQSARKRGFVFPFGKRPVEAPVEEGLPLTPVNNKKAASVYDENEKITWKSGANDSDQIIEIKNSDLDSPEAIPED